MGFPCFVDGLFLMDQYIGSWWRKGLLSWGLILDPRRRFIVIKACGRIPVYQMWSGKFLSVLHYLAKKWFLRVCIDLSAEFQLCT